MPLIFIIFSLFICLAQAQVGNWKSEIETLMSKDGNVVAARQKLESIKDLDQHLKKSIELGGIEERLALEAIRQLPRLSMVEHLLKKLKGFDFHNPEDRRRFVTLASLSDTEKGLQIVEGLKKYVDPSNSKLPASLRITVLESMRLQKQSLPVESLSKLLDDSSYELRLTVVNHLPTRINEQPAEYVPLLKKALGLSPYTLRLKVLDYISAIPEKQKADLRSSLAECAKNDQHAVVQAECQKIMGSNFI